MVLVVTDVDGVSHPWTIGAIEPSFACCIQYLIRQSCISPLDRTVILSAPVSGDAAIGWCVLMPFCLASHWSI